MSGLTRLRKRIVIIVVLALVSIVVPSHGATPGAGSISATSPSTQWQGQTYILASVAVPNQCPPNLDPANVLCDHFFLTIDLPPDFWNSNFGRVTISITWPSSDNDFDLYVYKVVNGDSQLVSQSASGGTSFETVVLFTPTPGTYEVRVVPFMVTSSGYNGSAQLILGSAVTNPSHSTGGISFAPAAVVDPQRTFGEPIIHRDRAGNLWTSGPWGASTLQSFVQKSTDNGDSYHLVSLSDTRPDIPPGGGDTDITTDDQGFVYFADLEGAFENVGVGVSNDGGNLWRKNAVSVGSTLVDRQWLAVDNGLTGSSIDNTVFLTFHVVTRGVQVFSSPGSQGVTDLTGGLVFQNAADTIFVAPDASCGESKFDPVSRNLYLVCGRGSHVEIIRGHVNPSTRTGIHFDRLAAPNSPGGGGVSDLFPVLSIDTSGNLYAVWVDKNNQNVYLSSSTDQGSTWSAPLQVNGDPANSNLFPWVAAGSPGLVDVVFLGTSLPAAPSSFPNWFNSRQAATVVKWFPYLAQVHFNFTSPASSTIFQTPASEHPTHYGQVCDSGTTCLETNGDRVMADFIAVTIDGDGGARVVYADTTNQHHGAAVYESRQIAGPTVFGTTLAGTPPANPILDPSGDAQSPHYSPASVGANQKALDYVSLRLVQHDAAHLTVTMQVLDASSLLPPPGADTSVWLTRWQVKATGDDGEESYRIFYVGAESVLGGSPTFFSGTGVSASNQGVPGDGCIVTAFVQVNPTTRNCKLILYPEEQQQTGTFNSITGELTVTVPLSSIGSPKVGDTLFSVTALSFGKTTGSPFLQDVDATRAFDYVITNGVTTVVQTVTGGGYIFTDSSGSKGNFGLVAGTDNKGKVTFVDHATGLTFRSSLITSVAIQGTTATIKGMGTVDAVSTTFTVTVQDNAEPGAGSDTFSISLGTGYTRSGVLQGGNIQIH